MNKTEQKAYSWLIEQGIPKESIVFNARGTFDFKTASHGTFEVKKLSQKSVYITQRQNAENSIVRPTYLIFSDNSVTPLLTGSIEEIAKKVSVRLLPKTHTICITNKTKKRLDKIARYLSADMGVKTVTYAQVIHVLLDCFEKKEGDKA